MVETERGSRSKEEEIAEMRNRPGWAGGVGELVDSLDKIVSSFDAFFDNAFGNVNARTEPHKHKACLLKFEEFVLRDRDLVNSALALLDARALARLSVRFPPRCAQQTGAKNLFSTYFNILKRCVFALRPLSDFH